MGVDPVGWEPTDEVNVPVISWLIWSVAAVAVPQVHPPARPPAPVEPRIDTEPSQSARVTSLRMKGVLEEYQEKTQEIAVTTSGDRVRLEITPTTRVRRGRHRIKASALAQYIGSQVVVRYTDSADARVVLSLQVIEADSGHHSD
jgi:hypothetical protein